MIPVIDQDKANHIVYGAAVTAVSVPLVGLWIAAILCFAVAVLKEYWYDARHSDVHTVDVKDIYATVAGCAIVAVSHIQLSWFQVLIS